jgi:hypothetical protein
MRSLAGPSLNEYGALVAGRKACRICVEGSPGKIRSCAEFDFDPDVVSHWELWLGHQRPKLLAVGQDFGNVGYFVRNRGRDDPNNKTNDNLRKLLTESGFNVTPPREFDGNTPVFLTNSILCIKEGPMDGAIRSSWVEACADRHLGPLVRYLQPPVVVGAVGGRCGGCSNWPKHPSASRGPPARRGSRGTGPASLQSATLARRD